MGPTSPWPKGNRLGNPMAFGGPYLGIMACREQFVRRMPGRLVGQTVDRRGKRCWVLTLQTREQHIRREKATSNICTNQGLLALRAAVYLAAMGPDGLRDVAELCLQKARYAAERLTAGDVACAGLRAAHVQGVRGARPPAAAWTSSCGRTAAGHLRRRAAGALVSGIGRLPAGGRHRKTNEGGDRPIGGRTGRHYVSEEYKTLPAFSCQTPTEYRKPKTICETPAPRNCCLNFPSPAAVRCGCRSATCPAGRSSELLPPAGAGRRSAAAAGIARARDGAALRQPLDAEHVGRHQFLSAGLVYDEVQSQAERAAGRPAGHGRPAPLPARSRRCKGMLALLYQSQQMLAEIAGLPAVSLQPAAGAHGELTALLVAAAYFRDLGKSGRWC